jgi:hypothetical protein
MDANYIGNLPGLAAPKLTHHPVVQLAPLVASAAPPSGVTPTSDNAPWQARVEGNEKTDNRDFASDDAHGKALATMKARAARCGCTLHALADGGFLVGRWGYSKALPCLRAVGDLLRQIGGRP